MRPTLPPGDELAAYPQRYAPGRHIVRDELKVLGSLSLAFMCSRTPLANEASGFDWLWFRADIGNLADGSTWICMSRV